jgi:peptidoglycan/xylan/chitin deacetylase (PgdA/CDA1 family)
MLSLNFFSNVDMPVKYAYREVMNHLGVPFREVQDVASVSAGDPRFELLVLPETSKIEENDVVQILSQNQSIMLSADLCLKPTVADALRSVTGRSLSIIGVGGSYPPTISGFLKLGASEQIPFFYPFMRMLVKPENVVRSEIVDLEGVRSSALISHALGSRAIILYCPQIFRTIAYLLGGSEATFPLAEQQEWGLLDRVSRGRDIVGRKTELGKRGYLETPVVNMYEKMLSQILIDVAKAKQVPLILKWQYPEAKSMCLCLTHDVDEFLRKPEDLRRAGFLALFDHNPAIAASYLLLSILAISPRLQAFTGRISETPTGKSLMEAAKKTFGLDSVRFTVEYLINQLRDIERKFDASSTFFFLSDLARDGSNYSFHEERVEKLIASLEEQGCEVALHAGWMNGGSELGSMGIEKYDLEKATERRVVGVRNHLLHLITPFGWRNQVGVGMIYDSTFGYNSDIGFKAACCLPFQPFDHLTSSVLPVLEIPPVIMDWTLHFWYALDMASNEALERCTRLVKSIHELNGVLTLIWHPAYDDQLYPGWNRLYSRILESCSNLRVWYASAAELAKWWNGRNAVHLERRDWDGHTLTLLLTSEASIPGFCVRIYLPHGVTVKDVHADRGRTEIITHEDETFVSLDVISGSTELRIGTS